MRNRNLTIGAIATAAAAIALPSTAAAHSLEPYCAPDGFLALHLTNWPTNALADLTVTVNDVTVRSGPYSAPSFDEPVLIGPFQGPLEVVAIGTMTGGRRFASRVGLVCITPPPADVVVETPTPGPTPTPTISGDVPVKVVTPGPRRTPEKRPKPTCAQLRRAGAGPLTYARLGHYYRCIVPHTITKPRPRPTVAVTG